MIKSSSHLWNQRGFIPKDSIEQAWHSAIHPLFNDFYHSFYQTYSSHLLDDFLFSGDNSTIFLKDGILLLHHLLIKILNNKNSIHNNFAIPKYLAPLIPQDLKDFFYFYQYETPLVHSSSIKSKALIYIPPFQYHFNLQLIIKQITQLSDNLNDLTIIRPSLNEYSLQTMFGKNFDINYFSECINTITSKFKKINIRIISSDQIKELQLDNYLYINSNHYRFFCSEDYLSFFYYLTNSQLSSLDSNFQESFFKHHSTQKHIKNNLIHFYKYEGPSLYNDSEIEFIQKFK